MYKPIFYKKKIGANASAILYLVIAENQSS